MKNYYLFFNPERCTGCQLCLLACSLKREGVCGENASLIHIFTHYRFGTSIPIIKEGCLETECKGECVEVCTPGTLKLADEEKSIQLMIDPKWQPVQVLFGGGK